MNPRITVLMTVYNGERFIAQSIESVLNQSFKNFEFIIVDDGSTDGTKDIILKYANKDKRIIYLYYGKNKGYYNLHNVVNMGLERARGKYIARLDADDLCYPRRLEIQYKYLENNPSIFLIGSSADVIDQFGNKIDTIIKKRYPPFILKYRMAISNPFIHSSIMFRNKGYKYISYNEHCFYFILTFFKKKMKNIKGVLIKYRINPYGVMSAEADLTSNKYKHLYLKK
ncbi:MAG TPA: glycosyltransferase family A protein [Candidatus Pacearchaeota archaeon]|jgi:glycosyltransferase involved in cell wall biosynthesis|nr:glycosyltransferase family A protein [Candidatus Pacearchaeota archaeon]HOC96973.1 glycosyltransferase family A protein [Candidatus Pacearchaeota archaeon]HPX74812.1 glycosyltransferase family A protein [Candidatus Pacearchaeota archaeon]